MLIQKYSSQWVRDFTDIKAELEKGLSGLECSIEHVGSTSVPNLDAKPIIDIDIIYPNPAAFSRIRSGLEKIGYYHNGNQGIEDREVFKRSGAIKNEVLDSIMHHLYVCPIHSPALERHLLSRDHLRANEWARATYQQMKYEIAAEVNQDRKKYAALKEERVNAFIDLIIAKEKLKTNPVQNTGKEP
ncbi:GrpB family protein [Flavihumibacter rivuli]|uniref:GrpB family protein n=1 Tax=Flavihumibacter rivuli TaxID=2838156 RepID=UPI001BDEB90E|nr:GrpB family protein [Flavihumibacter rivuli]ULQ57113.1 GrpB family protein [Flavihumibacter rivuli]